MQEDVFLHGVSRWELLLFVQLTDSPITSGLLNFHLMLTSTCHFCWHASHWTSTPCFQVFWPRSLTRGAFDRLAQLSVSCSHARTSLNGSHASSTLLRFSSRLPSTCFVRPCRLHSATLLDLQLLSNTYCQTSETCNLSFARCRPANSTRYINKKNGCCNPSQCVCARACFGVWETAELKDGKKFHRREKLYSKWMSLSLIFVHR